MNGQQYNSVYSPQRQPFAIHEILGLSNCRQSPEFVDGYNNYGVNQQYPTSNGFDSQTQPGFFRDQNVQSATSFCPWRYDTNSHASSRYPENMGYGVKAPVVDQGGFLILYLFVMQSNYCQIIIII